jgi:methionine-rich copper-binding protein CopC
MKTFKSLLTALLTMLCMAPAVSLARSHLDTTLPVRNSTINVSPEKLLLMFSEAVELTSLTLHREGDREPMKIASLPRWPGRPLTVRLPQLTDGVYTVNFHVMNADQHETRGSFEFTLATHPRWPRARNTAEAPHPALK